jgi:hypothetical protein
MSERNLDKLPKWARDEIVRLRADNAALRTRLDEPVIGNHHPDTNLYLESESDKHGLNYEPSRFCSGRFQLRDHWSDFIDFRIDQPWGDGKRRVYVHSGVSTLVVKPRAGNAIILETAQL